MNFDSHIKKLTSELDLSACQNEEKGKEIIEDAQEMKDLINQQKKLSKKKKRPIQFTEEMANEQLNLFAKANLMMASGINVDGPTNEESQQDRGNKKRRIEQMEKDILGFVGNKDEEVDFD